jgi:DNA-binding NarL/FixJ family response regulator
MYFRVGYGTLLPEGQHDGAKREVETKPTILILAMPGDLQTSLQMLLSLLCDVAVLVTAESSSALQAIEKYAPALVIMDFALPGEDLPKIVHLIKANLPTIPCLVLVDDEQQRQRAQNTGADLVLVKGYPAAKLLAAIEGLLSQRESNS